MALRTGYRHIDADAINSNEIGIGKAIRDSGVPREEIFVTTKLTRKNYGHPKEALDESLEKLGLDYVDLFLMHLPVATGTIYHHEYVKYPSFMKGVSNNTSDLNYIKTYDLMQELVGSGKTKAIGVSNFSVKYLKKLIEAPSTNIKPAVNQTKLHPLFQQPELLQYCKEQNIILQAYSSLGPRYFPLINHEIIKTIGDHYNVDPATILISWALSKGVVVLPKSSTPSRIESNLQVVEFTNMETDILNNINEYSNTLGNW